MNHGLLLCSCQPVNLVAAVSGGQTPIVAGLRALRDVLMLATLLPSPVDASDTHWLVAMQNLCSHGADRGVLPPASSNAST